MKGILLLFLGFSSHYFSQITIRGVDNIEPLVAAYRSDFVSMIGYRIQICFDSNKSIVDEAKSKFISAYPKTEVYMVFENPNFNLMVGDFRTLIAAEKMKARLYDKRNSQNNHKIAAC